MSSNVLGKTALYLDAAGEQRAVVISLVLESKPVLVGAAVCRTDACRVIVFGQGEVCRAIPITQLEGEVSSKQQSPGSLQL